MVYSQKSVKQSTNNQDSSEEKTTAVDDGKSTKSPSIDLQSSVHHSVLRNHQKYEQQQSQQQSQYNHNNLLPVHYLHELPAADEERLEKLFNQLDKDSNGRIDIHDLSAALKEFGLSSVYAETFLQQSDKTQSGDVGLAEFIHYVREHEKNLRLQFSHLDKNKDGKVDLEELICAFKELGIEMDPNEATNLLQRMDQDGSLNISFDEWRDFLLLAPSTDIHDLIKFWRHSTPNLQLFSIAII